MKKIYIHLMMLAAMVVAGAAMTSCNKEEVATGKFKMSINATKGGDNSKQLNLDGTTLNATWAEGEKVKVYNGATMLGTLTAQSAGESTTLDGELQGTVAENNVLTLKFCSDNYTSQDGTLAYIAANCDYATASVTVSSVGGGVVRTQESSAPFVNQQAIVKFTLLNKANSAAISPSALTVTDGTHTVSLTDIPNDTYTTNGASNVLYVAFPAAGSAKTITLTATVGDDTYTYEKSGVTFTNGQYYEITVKMTKKYKMAAAATSADKGKLICTDGHIHAYGADAACTKARVAKIVYVGSDNGESAPYNHGLALALSDANGGSTCQWKTSQTDAGHTYKPTNSSFSSESGLQYNATHNSDTYPAFKAAIANNGTTAPTGCSAWFLASGYQWVKMANAAGGYTDLHDGFSSVGGSNLQSYWWSSTEYYGSNGAWYYSFASGIWNAGLKDYGGFYVRACLAF